MADYHEISSKWCLQNFLKLMWFIVLAFKWFLIFAENRNKLMTMFQCLPFFTFLLYLPSRYFQQSRFDPSALNSCINLFNTDTNFCIFYCQWVRVTLFSFVIQVDVSVIEVGLGGKYDATNVVYIVVISTQMCSVCL